MKPNIDDTGLRAALTRAVAPRYRFITHMHYAGMDIHLET